MEDRTLLSSFLVSNTDDSGTGSLRQAILDANAQPGTNDITFDPTAFATPQTITLTSGQLELSSTSGMETITGPAAGVTVNAGKASRVFQVDANVTASISGMTITDGQVGSYSGGGWGGGLLNYGATTLTNCTVSGNHAVRGGGLATGTYHNKGGSTTLTNCTVSGNYSYFSGGGLYNGYSTLSLTNCTVSGNVTDGVGGSGGGVYAKHGSTMLINSTVSDNSTKYGGGLFNKYSTTTATNCTVSGNSAGNSGGGIFDEISTDSLTNCTVSGNSSLGRDGGGLTSVVGTTTLTNCAVTDNSTSGDGGGLATFPTAASTLTNCIVSGNSAATGGGAWIDGTLTSSSSTFASNSATGNGGGLYLGPNYLGPPTVALVNTIVAQNTAADAPDVSGEFTSHGNNLIGESNDSSGWLHSDLTGTIAAPLDALLSPMGNFGGPTQTMALLPGSPALGAGNNNQVPHGVTTDQRGLPRVVNGKVDIGAFESSGFTIAVTSGSGQSTNVRSAFPTPLVVTVTANNPVEPVAGGLATFTPPASGASAVLTGSPATISASGTASVTASGNAVVGSYTVSSTASGAPVAASFSLTNVVLVSIVVTPGNPELAEGVTGQFTAMGTYSDGSTRNISNSVTWASGTHSVATISGTGLATARALGTSAITASLTGVISPADTLTVIDPRFVVRNTDDSGPGSLRQAILNANANPGQTITFDFTVFATPQAITLTSGQLELSDTSGTETIMGPAAGVTVSGDNASRVFQVDSKVTASISGITITGGTTTGNGGGLYSDGGNITLNNCSVSGNSAKYGGGLYINDGGAATLTNSTVSVNSASFGGGLDNHGTATLTSCTISSNTASSSGGGLETFTGTLKLTNCTVSGNSAGDNGGGLYNSNGAAATLTECTVSGNFASGEGGGLYNNPGSTSPQTTVMLGDTIAAGNTTGNLGADVFGSFVSKGHNLIGETDGSTGWVSSDLTGTMAAAINPLLAPLGNFGGPTQTMPLLPGSPAIDAGNNALIPAGITTDQRGLSRIVNGTVDIGAFESRGFTLNYTSGSGQSAGGWPTSGEFSVPLVVTVTAKNSIEPVAGGQVTFTTPASGATAELTDSPATLSASGAASVTATRNGVTGSYIVSATVRGAPGKASFLLTNLALVSIAVTPGNPELAKGVAGQFIATGTYTDGSTGDITPDVTWGSATPSVATISGTGLATALALGTSAITASRAGITSPVDTLTVIAPGFVVNTNADDFGFFDGTTSLREAITFANAPSGPATITFALPGGSTTIHLLSPLPAITKPVVIDGTTQPGYAGTPLIDLTGQPLAISSEVTVRGVAFDGLAFGSAAVPEELAVSSMRLPGSAGGTGNAIGSYPFTTITGEDLTVVVQGQGVTTRLLLMDAMGTVLMQSDGQSAGGDDLINLYVPAGTYSLEVQDQGGAGTYSLTATAAQATSPLQLLDQGVTQVISSIVANDFTGDGHLDLAFTSYAAGKLSPTNDLVTVLLSNGDGTFAPPVTYAVGMTEPGDQDGIVAGDFTGDGHLDLAVSNSGSNTVSVLLGDGDGTFQPQATYAVGQAPQGLVAGDFTGDGHLDLAVANSGGNTVSVLPGNGDGTFQPQVTYAVGQAPRSLVAGDFTGDGHLDLAVGNYSSNTVSVLLGDGDGTFAPQVTYAVATGLVGIVAGDFTGDGHLDLAVAETNPATNAGEVSVLLNQGGGTFAPQVTYNVGVDARGIVAGDFTGDGHLDLAVASAIGSVSVLVGNGDGTFRAPITCAVGGTLGDIVSGDFFGDGRIDLAVAVNGTNFNVPTDGVSLLLGEGDGTFVPLSGTLGNAVGAAPNAIVAGDFTGDGQIDLAVANVGGNTVSVLLGNGDGTFAPQVSYAVGTEPEGLVVGDFNGDGLLDLAVANYGSNTVSVLLGNGDGTFAPQVTYAVGSDPQAIVAGDFTGDGRIDLVVSDEDGTQILLGNGDGTFQVARTIAPGISGSLVAGDFTGDGLDDLAIAGGGDNGTVSVLLSKGDGAFAPPVTYVVGMDPIGIVAGDFTGDGHLDLVVANQGQVLMSPGSVSVLLGYGNGTFASPVTYNLSENPNGIVAGDFTGDGHLDLALTSQDDYSPESVELIYSTTLLLGTGKGTFTPEVTLTSQNQYDATAIAAADFTGNGNLDLAIVELTSGSVSVLLGNGDGTFTDPNQLATTPHATPLAADVNGDGAADVLVVDSSGNILYRQGIPGQPGSFLPPVTVNPGNPSCDIAWLPDTSRGPVLASVDAQDDAISFYAYRDGQFVRLGGSLPTGQFPAQIIAAPLNGDGLEDLIVRNAGDGTLTVYFGSPSGSRFGGAAGTLDLPSFTAAVTLPVGLGVSDVQAVDTTGNGLLDLVVTNKLTGEIGILMNLGDGAFAPLEPYRAGTGFSALNPGSTPEITSIDTTAGVAAGPFTAGGPMSLVTINPASNTLDVLAGLGGGRFANPVTIDTPSPAEVVRMADFADNGLSDLAVLTANGVSIYLGDGKGGFSSPVTYDAGVDPTGLTVADILGNNHLDLLIGNNYGDVLILVGNGDGTFKPFEPVKQAIALAVADLTGNGVPDFVFADQSLNQITVQYGTAIQSAAGSQVIGNQSMGILAPGAVLLADLIPNQDGQYIVPDLIVANSGGNNVLVYPGLGNGQFGPPINGTAGFPVGTDPTGLTVANLNGQPDLLVADTGSNDVSVLLGEGSGSSWTMISGARIQTDAGPVALVVGHLLGPTQTDLAVANSGADNVQIFPSVGGGYFNDQATAVKTYAVGQAPSSLFAGNFSGLGQGLATLNAGSNNGTLIGNLGSANPVLQTFPTGGDTPTAGFAGDFTGNGFTDLVVGNNGDGTLSLLMGGAGGLSLFETVSSVDAPSPTSVSFGGVSNGLLDFYVSTAGVESAMNLAFNLSGEPSGSEGTGSEGGATSVIVTATEGSSAGVLTEATSGSVQSVSQLLTLSGTTLDLAATLLTVSVVDLESGGGSSATGGSTGAGQGQRSSEAGGSSSDLEDEPSDEAEQDAGAPRAIVEGAQAWERLVLGLDRSWERARALIQELDGRLRAAENRKATIPAATGAKLARPVSTPARPSTRGSNGAQAKPTSSSKAAIAAFRLPMGESLIPRPEHTGPAVDAALEDIGADRHADGPSRRSGIGLWDELAQAPSSERARALVTMVASAAVASAGWTLGKRGIRRRSVSIRRPKAWYPDSFATGAN